jgi:carbon monoxide dehydrogenase subunit G
VGEEAVVVGVERSFIVDRPVGVVADYLKDFANTEEWDPGTLSCVRQGRGGPVRVGTTWTNVSEFRGKDTELEYRLETCEPDRLVFVGENRTASTRDEISMLGLGRTGTSITYRAQVTFHGLAKLAEPLLQREFEKLADRTQIQLTKVLNNL